MDDLFIDERKLLKLLEEMIRIDSVNPSLVKGGKGESKIAHYIGNLLEEIGLEVKFQEIRPDRVNVIGMLRGNGNGKSLMLNGHTDTVSTDKMDIEPLTPKYDEGKVYGRGSLDMKSGLSAMIMAADAIVKSGLPLKGDVILAFVADEEYASIGTEELIKEYSADAAIVCEPTSLEICIAHKGFAWTKVEVFGKAAHGSRPDEGIDAIVNAGKILFEVDELACTIFPQKKHPLLGSPSIHASLISGGTELSIYPDCCKIELERRTIPGENYGTVVDEVKDLIDKISRKDEKFKANFEVFFHRPPYEIPKNELIVRSLEKAYESVLKKEPKHKGLSFWTDSAILKEAGIPAVIFGPSGEGLHASVEYVDFDSVIETARVLARVIVDFCNS
ncbi:MAG: ArgE/DapE family deacylase [Acidobacteriota bacterium]